MGEYLIIPHKLHDKINKLPGNTFQIYLMLLRCVVFKPYSRKPIDGTDFFTYPFSKAKKYGYSHNKTYFTRGIKKLVELEYIEITRAGHFQGHSGFRQQNLYRLLIF